MSVMDKDGNVVREKYYDNWNDFVLAYILTVSTSEYTPILSEDYKKTESKYENLYKLLIELQSVISDTRKVAEILKTLKTIRTDDTYYIEWKIEDLIFRKYQHFQFVSSRYEQERAGRSIMALTEGFENDPIKAYVRFHYLHRCKNYDELRKVLDIYWIYLFQCNSTIFKSCIPFVHISKINPKKALDLMNDDSPYYCSDLLSKAIEYREKKYESTIEQLKEQHQKEIEELLAPGGAGYSAAKERFESNQKELDDELN